MSKWKIIFIQAILIPMAILLARGIEYVILHYTEGFNVISWPWYAPISYILTGVVTSPLTLILCSTDNITAMQMKFRIGIHFVITGAVVSLCGFLFRWYETLQQYLPIFVLYVVIYTLVWVVTTLLRKSDEKKINNAIKYIQDKE